jgi:hypothetical protein
MTRNPELDAARSSVPEIDAAERRLTAAKELLADVRYTGNPEQARDAVLDEAAAAFVAGGTWPTDLATRASRAYDAEEVASLERQGRQRAVTRAEWNLYEAVSDHSSAALEFLGARLADVLSDAQSAFQALGGANSAEDAISAGPDAVAAWTRLRTLTRNLEQVRQAQWSILRGPRVPGGSAGDADSRVHVWKRQGHGHVRGLNPSDAPAFVREAIRTDQVSLQFLHWTASQEGAYVPRSDEELEADIATSKPDAFEGEVRDVTPVELPARQASRPADVYGHSRAPHLDASQPAPAKPVPNATVADPASSAPTYF